MKRAIFLTLVAALVVPAGLAMLSPWPGARAQEKPTADKLDELIESLRAALREKEQGVRRAPLRFELRIYDVRDLTTPLPDYPAEQQGLMPSGGFGFGLMEECWEEPMPFYEVDALVDMIRETVAPMSWDELSSVDVRAMNNGLILVRHTPAVHDMIAAMFAELRNRSVAQIVVDARLVRLSDATLRSILGPDGGSVLDAASESRLAAAIAGGTAVVSWSGQITCSNTQRVGLSDASRVSYVQDYDVEIAQGSCIGDPIVMNLMEGMTVEVKPVVAGLGELVVMEVRAKDARLAGPIDGLDTPVGRIETPVLSLLEVRTTIAAEVGRTVVVGGATTDGDGRAQLLLLKPSVHRPGR